MTEEFIFPMELEKVAENAEGDGDELLADEVLGLVRSE